MMLASFQPLAYPDYRRLRTPKAAATHSVNVPFLCLESAWIPAVLPVLPQCRGLVGCAFRKAARHSALWFLRPTSSRRQSSLPGFIIPCWS